MLYEMMKALDDANGVTEDIWLNILRVVGDKDPSINNVSCFGGRYYITDIQRNRLRYVIPFLNGEKVDGVQLALPPYIEPTHPLDIRCGRCTGPFHPATGHAFSVSIVACGPCYGRFAAWQMQKYGWKPLHGKELKKMRKKEAKERRKAHGLARALVRQAAEQVAEYERLYGIPREAQPAKPDLEQ